MKNIQRFVVSPGLKGGEQIKEALTLVFCLNKQISKPSDVVLFIPTKAQLVSETFSTALGRDTCRTLKKGQKIQFPDKFTLTCETKRTFNNYMATEVILCVFPDDDMLKTLDSVKNLKAAVVVPWRIEEVSEWIRAWNPVVLGEEHGEAERLIENPIVEETMVRLTKCINTSTGLTHPSDKSSAVELLRRLQDNGVSYDPASLRAWALRHDWTPQGAEDLEKYAQAVLNRRPVHGNKHV